MSRLRSLRILPDRPVKGALLVIGWPGAVVLLVGITLSRSIASTTARALSFGTLMLTSASYSE